MIRVSRKTGAETVALTGYGEGVTVTLRRLTTPQYRACIARAMDLLRDPAALSQIIVRHELAPTGQELNRFLTVPEFQSGIAEWLGYVECAIEAVDAWTGIETAPGVPAPLAKDRTKIAGVAAPVDEADLAARAIMELLLLDHELARQLMGQIDGVARILATEGNA